MRLAAACSADRKYKSQPPKSPMSRPQQQSVPTEPLTFSWSWGKDPAGYSVTTPMAHRSSARPKHRASDLLDRNPNKRRLRTRRAASMSAQFLSSPKLNVRPPPGRCLGSETPPCRSVDIGNPAFGIRPKPVPWSCPWVRLAAAYSADRKYKRQPPKSPSTGLPQPPHTTETLFYCWSWAKETAW